MGTSSLPEFEDEQQTPMYLLCEGYSDGIIQSGITYGKDGGKKLLTAPHEFVD